MSAFWRVPDASPEVNAFISCLSAGGQGLCRRGRMGDICSIPVLHQVVRYFIQHYLRYASEITSETARAA
ncbi:hypothetical protein BZT13_19185 [Salmonella enterica subsp. enterica]|uniref:hypothetical protein n=1 Tax=Salmonella enterica TaxID=28901 RepID=UPI0003BCA109|nr:hypothetical protein [Salmonella enterica]EBV4574340.1 hypothetical protein [Salmonella enterica subsp. enterica serovar Oranienburg]EBY8227575.1 hypothetical protein [Salmonella enterica subsp. enterica serovar Adelaide]ECE0440361.1 hypothetical protein [Salmonella enterica subsp. enterica]ECV0008078.1 hypothetical protein [Salmonella enterica subsp. enterica serovar Saintpaul]EDE8095627.1 hypothetical protein [Salmonella enterica subsp. enterica serovar Newport]EIG0950085.1 hypothetical 